LTTSPQPAAQSNEDRSARTRRLILAVVTAILTRPVSLAFQVITVPMLLAYLGRERYGVFETVSALAVWMSLANAGLSMGLVNNLVDCYVSGDREGARRHVSSTVVPLGAIVVTLGVLSSMVVPFVPWRAMFRGLGDESAAGLSGALLLAIVATLAASLTSVPSAIYAAYQENHRNNLWDAASKVFAIGACYAVVRSGLGLIGAVLAMAAVPVLVRLANGAYLLTREKPWLRPRVADFNPVLFGQTLRQSTAFFALSIGPIALYQADKLLVAVMLGPAAAADYALVGRVFVLVYGIFALVYTPLWPGHGEALRRGDLLWIRRTVLLTVSLSLACAAALGVVMLAAGDRLLSFWLRAPVQAPAALVLAFTATFALRAWVDCRSVVLNSAGMLRPQMFFWIAHMVLAIGLAVPLGLRFGAAGVAWGVPLGAALTSLWGYPMMMRRLLRTVTGPRPARPTADEAAPVR
jgi:O-antigen/teichoic acid export membrane protein